MSIRSRIEKAADAAAERRLDRTATEKVTMPNGATAYVFMPGKGKR